MPKYMIHACLARMWYVEEFLIPSMLEQGIEWESITIWNDAQRRGNLIACMDSFLSLAGSDGGTWHLQDDVIICRDFASLFEGGGAAAGGDGGSETRESPLSSDENTSRER